MDPIGTSCLSLHIDNKEKILQEESKQDQKFQEIIASCRSLSSYESKTWKTTLPQILATSLVASFHIVVGISLAYSAILLPQLRNDPRFLPSDEEQTWLASIIIIANPVGAVIAGVLMDRIGRLHTIKLSAIPGVIGWGLIALGSNVNMVLAGRFMTGISSALGSSPAIVYITEIARADMRGALISFAPSFASIGMVLSYLLGYLLEWRIVAWISGAFCLLTVATTIFVPESPAWLITKGKVNEAGKALQWIHKYQPQPDNKNETYAEMQLHSLQENHKEQLIIQRARPKSVHQKLKELLKPTGYKPLLIIFGLFLFQQFSGIYVTLFYSVNFFESVGSKMNPYQASIIIGVIRLIMSILNTYMLRTFRRRPLIICSCVGMSICIGLSGLFTHLVKQGSTHLSWAPVTLIILFVVTSMIGLLPIPWTITAELFPIEIRGLAHSISYGVAFAVMFAAIKSYYALLNLLGGTAGVQWLFSVVSACGFVYAVLFMPETHGKKLEENVDYFRHNWFYVKLWKRDKGDKKGVSRLGDGDVGKLVLSKEESEKLVEVA